MDENESPKYVIRVETAESNEVLSPRNAHEVVYWMQIFPYVSGPINKVTIERVKSADEKVADYLAWSDSIDPDT